MDLEMKGKKRLFGSLLGGTLSKFKKENENKTEAEIRRELLEKRLAEKLLKERIELSQRLDLEKKEKLEKLKAKREEEHRAKQELRVFCV